MRRWKFTALAIGLLSVAINAQTVDDIIAKSIQAHGGMAKLKAVKSMRITGDIETGGMQPEFTQVFKRPMKFRLDVSIQGLTLTQAYDGQNGWAVVPFTGKKDPEPMTADDLKVVLEQADFDGPLVDYKQKGNTVELVGKEKMEGTDVYHLKVTLKTGDIRNLYLDADSFLTIKETGKTTMRGTEVDMQSTLGDYKEVQGVLFPFSVDQQQTGGQGPGAKITVKKIEVNVPVDDSVFKMPAAAPPPAPAPSGNQPKPDSRSKPPQN